MPLMAMPVWLKKIFFAIPDNIDNPVVPLVIANTNQLQTTISAESLFSWELVGFYFYGFISFVLLLRLIWAYRYIIQLKKGSELSKFKGFKTVILRDKQMSPFSFFRTIYLPKSLEKSIDKNLVLEHEKVHCNQWHSIDISLAELLLVFHWWNPFAWWLRKLIALNHDYNVDKLMLKQASEPKQYQFSLINILSGKNQVQLVNNFNKNLTKKRIIMMNKANTKSYIAWLKVIFIVPIVALLFLGFTNSDKTNSDGSQEVILNLTAKVNNYKHEDTNVTTKENKHNKKVNTSIKTVSDKQILTNVNTETKVQKKIKGTVSSTETLKPIEEVKIFNKYGELLATTNKKGKFSFKFVGNPNTPKEHQGEILFVKEGFQPTHYKLDLMSDNKINIELKTENKDKTGKIENEREIDTRGLSNALNIGTMNDYTQPLFLIDGMESTKKVVNSLNQNSIQSISIIKDKIQLKPYGDKGKNGVIIVTLKDESKLDSKKAVVMSIDEIAEKDHPLYIVDGKEWTYKEIKNLDKNSIESTKVHKDKLTIEKHGKKAKNGIIFIKLKDINNK